MGPGPVWTGTEIFGPIGIRTSDSPARNVSLCRLSYPGPPENGKFAAIVSNSGTAEGGRSSSLRFGRVNNSSSPANTQRLTNVRKA